MKNESHTEHQDKSFLGHPKGLFILFLTEMWERFSFYGMKALLIHYLVKYHLFSDESGNLIVGSYAAMVYALPVIGGYLADRYLGFRKAVVFGAIMLVLGHLGLAFEGSKAYVDAAGNVVRDGFALDVFFFSLSLIILGVGFLKANISSIVGALYEENDQRRDSGFTIFYMGINLGSFMATLLCGYLGETYGWGYGFGAAGIGMLFGLVTFIYGQKFLHGKAEPKDKELLSAPLFGPVNREWLIYILAVLSLVGISQMVQNHTIVDWMLRIAGLISLIMIIYFGVTTEKVVRERLFALTILIIFSVVFWALFEQAYTSLNLYAERVTDRNFFGWEIPGSWYLSLNALFIILFAPVVASVWVRLGKYDPNVVVKFGIAIVLVGLGFGALVFGIETTAAGTKIAMIWLVLAYFFHTIGELCLSPVGLSSVTKLAPQKIVGFMMGVWFLATAASEFIAALLANLAKMDTNGGEVEDIGLAVTAYQNLFSTLFYAGLIIGGFLLLISPLVKKLMHGVK
ncbi:MAG: peptide MFS transporter [Saprospiraceae bacterium]|nr:peptide MFS transporter [Saprospiraceae bacterium]MBK8079094.1 peptide MFS transporter [Saprospiraceae bacterium]MBK8547258.1 peptide MFS transporter [Saprospiraceae bacterium]MBK8818467.1 peptide MFS transporter [Saprospiraceae bacterium]MBK9042250.1 peptide MFS transporter [Saprospiraceae bacterium]